MHRTLFIFSINHETESFCLTHFYLVFRLIGTIVQNRFIMVTPSPRRQHGLGRQDELTKDFNA